MSNKWSECMWQKYCVMTVNIWKSYLCTAIEETNVEAILAVMNTTESVVEIRPEKNQAKSGQLKKFKSTTSSVMCITARIASVFKNGVVTVNSYRKYWWRCVHVSVVFKIKPDCWML